MWSETHYDTSMIRDNVVGAEMAYFAVIDDRRIDSIGNVVRNGS